MSDPANYRSRLVALLDELAVQEGAQPTRVPGVHVFRGTESAPRQPLVYRPNIIIVGQGQKHAYLGGEVYTYNPFNYLLMAVPLPAECDAEAQPGKPILIATIDVDSAMVGELLLEMDEASPVLRETPRGIATAPMSEELGSAVMRLLECARSPLASRLLGRQTIREVIYRVLCGEQGGALASRDEHFTRIARVLKLIHADYAKPFSTEELARRAGMSESVFHHHFKLVTASSPLQYLKRIRLDRAKILMAHEGYNASTAAKAVGYESPSQFSREFKRLFGATPIEDAERSRARSTTE